MQVPFNRKIFVPQTASPAAISVHDAQEREFRLKGSMLVTIGVLLSTARRPHVLASEKSLSKICMFQPKEWATV
jgi:hypothetical protein